MSFKEISIIIEDSDLTRPIWHHNLRFLLEHHGINAFTLSKGVPIRISSIYYILHYKSNDIKISTIKILCNFFEVSIDHFVRKSFIENGIQRFLLSDPNEDFLNKMQANILSLIAETNLTKKQVSELSGIQWNIINSIYHYGVDFMLSNLIPFANFFCVTIDELIGDIPISKDRQKGFYIPQNQIDNRISNYNRHHYIPILNHNQIFEWINFNDSDSIFEVNKIICNISKDIKKSKKSFAIEIRDTVYARGIKGIAIVNAETKRPSDLGLLLLYNYQHQFFFVGQKLTAKGIVAYFNPKFKENTLSENIIVGAIHKII